MTDEQPTPPALRASDAERERAATTLREQFAVGRLTSEELSDRLDVAYAALTVAELDALLHDLPPATAVAAAGSPAPGRSRAGARVLHAVGYAALVNAACIAIWLATGAEGSFWPKWVLLATAIRLAFRTWGELGPGARHDEARLGRGGAERAQRPIDRR